jgi:citrate lyase beta subunit
LDLEDAVAAESKIGARSTVVEAIRGLEWSKKTLSVRVNDIATRWFEGDVIDVVSAIAERIDTIVLPKTEHAADVRTLALMLGRIERERRLERRIGIEPQIESALGLTHAEAIAAAHERVESLTFGPADFAASIGSPVLTIGSHKSAYPGHLWHYPMAKIVSAAKSAGLAAIDGPYGVLGDVDGLLESAAIARALGYDGKWAIHPDQIAPITEAFTPSEAERQRAQQIAERYSAGAAVNRGAMNFEGELLDAASLKLARNVLHQDQPEQKP